MAQDYIGVIMGQKKINHHILVLLLLPCSQGGFLLVSCVLYYNSLGKLCVPQSI